MNAGTLPLSVDDDDDDDAIKTWTRLCILSVHVPLRFQAFAKILPGADNFLWYSANAIGTGANAVKLPC